MKQNVVFLILLLLLQSCLSEQGIQVEKGAVENNVVQTKKISLNGVSSLSVSSCAPVVLNSLDNENQSLVVSEPLTIALSIVGAGNFFSDSGCSLGISSVDIPGGASLTTVYYSSSVVGSAVLRGTASTYASGTLAIDVTNNSSVAAPLATKLKVSGSQSLQTGMCAPLNLLLLDQNNNSFATTADRTISFSGVSNLYSDFSCSSTVTSIDLNTGESNKLFYVNVASAGGYVLTSSSPGLASDNFPIVVMEPASGVIVESNLEISGPSQFSAGLCIPFNVSLLGSNGLPMISGSSRTVSIAGVSASHLFSNSTCSVALGAFSISSGSASSTFYLQIPTAGSAVLVSSSTGLVPANYSILVTEVTSGSPPALSKVKISGAQSLQKDLCAPLNLSLLDQFNNAIVAPSATLVNLSGVSSVYSDSACATTAASISFSTGESNKLFYLRVGSVGGHVLTGTSVGLTQDIFPLVVIDTSSSGTVTESNLEISGPNQFSANSCVPFTVNLLGSNGLPMLASADRTITLSGTILGNLFSDSACATGLSSLSDLEITTGAASVAFYLRLPSPGSSVLTASSTGLTPGNISLLATSTASNPVAQALAVQGVYSSGVNDCIPMSATVLNSNNVPMSVTATTTVNFAASAGGLAVYSDPICSSSVTSLSLLTGEGLLNFYARGSASGNYMLTLSSTGLSSANHPLNISSAPTVPVPYKLYLSTVSQAVQDVCTPITVTSQDASGNAINVASTRTVSVSDIGDVDFFTDAACASSTSSVSITSGTNTSVFYFKANTGLSAILMASSAGLADGQFNLSILPPSGATGSPVQLRFLGASGITTETCNTFFVQSVDENNIIRNVSSAKTVNLTGVGAGSFYSDSGCSAAITSTTISSGSNSSTVYYRNNTVENVLVTASATGLTQGSFSVVVTLNPDALGGLKIDGLQNVLSSTCTPYSVSAIKNNGGVKTLSSTLAFTLNIIPGINWFTNSTCSTALVTPQILSGNTSVTYYMQPSTTGSYLLRAESGTLNPGVLGVSVGTNSTDIGISFEDNNFVVSEDHGSVSVRVLLTAPAIGNISVPFTVSGSAARPADHNLASGNLIIASGATQGLINFVIYDEILAESDETIQINLGTAPLGYYLGAKNSLTITIKDNDSGNTSLASYSSEIEQIVAGSGHTCALNANGGVQCWGENSYGQLGNSTTTSSVAPVNVTGLTSGVVKISAGGSYTCAVTNTGAARCWGSNDNGQLGNGTTTNYSFPVNVTTLSSGVANIVAGSSHTCALTSGGGVKCWGFNSNGQLGDGGTTQRTTPNNVSGLTTGVRSLSVGDYHSCAVTTAGAAKCWGRNNQGQIGNGGLPALNVLTPSGVSGLDNDASSITTGANHSCAVMNSGSVKCWGNNGYGQLGDGGTADSSTPVNSAISGVIALSAGSSHTCALTTSGGVKCWGINGNGQMGDGTSTHRYTAVDVIGLTSGVSFLSSGANHICAATSRGAKCWGYNAFSQLGIDTAILSNSTKPIQNTSLHSALTARGIIKFAINPRSSTDSCVQFADGISCWGQNSQGQSGYGDTQSRLYPNLTDVFGEFRDVSMGENHACGVTMSGGVKCWGLNTNYQLGDGTTTQRLTPVDVSGLTSGVVAVSVGNYHSCVLTATGGIKCWGANSGRLGDGTTVSRSTPVDVTGLTSGVQSISAGQNHTCAVTIAGGAKCWGDNANGRLGDGTTTQRLTAVDVSGLTSGVRSISAGQDHTCAVTTSGGAKCWGLNSQNHLGDGTTTQRLVPTDVSGLTSGVQSISAGYYHSCAVTTSGGAKCWGYNQNGRLGDGTILTRSTPVDVSGLTSGVQSISAGGSHTCASLTSKEGRCWGNNAYGNLGNGNTTQSTVPAVVQMGLPSATQRPKIFVGESHSCIAHSNKVYCWGENSYGQLGTGDTNPENSAIEVSASFGEHFIESMALGQEHTCVMTYTGLVKCLGRNDRGQLGDNTTIDKLSAPIILGGANRIVAGNAFNCATTNSDLRCWGANDSGQLGDGTYVDKLIPTLISSSLTSGISAGPASTCASSSLGTYCWGDNSYGQLGLGDGSSMGANFATPQSVGTSLGIVAMGERHSCAISGSVYCAGDNSYGQLGDTPGGMKTSFTAITNVPASLVNPTDVIAGLDYSCVRDYQNGKVFCWGNNSVGQLGQDRIAFTGVPTQVPGLSNTVSLVGNGRTNCALRRTASGSSTLMAPQCFGAGADGQLGNGSNADSPVPVFVQGAP